MKFPIVKFFLRVKTALKRHKSNLLLKDAADWRENVMRLSDGLYQTDLRVPNCHRTIALVNLTTGIAYQLVSENESELSFYRNVFNAAVVNQKIRKFQRLVIIADKRIARRIRKELVFTKILCADNFEIEVVGF